MSFKILNKFEIEFIDDIHQFHKFWSLQLSAVGAIIMSIFMIWPDSALYLWAFMPNEVRALIPSNIASFIAVILFGMSALSRIIKQKKLNKEPDERPN